MQGYIFLHRQLKENWLWKDRPFSKGQAWIDILLRVNHKPAKVPIGNQIVEVEKGQTIWSVKDMANEWGWSRKKVDNFLKVLESDSMISQKRTSKYTLVTVENWASYQIEGQQKNINGTSNEHQTNTNKNDNNKKNEKKNSQPKWTDEDIEFKLSRYLYRHILKNNDTAKEPNYQTWADHIDKMIRIDKRKPDDIKAVIEFCQKDDFWASNILSTSKLRKQYDQLYMKMKPNNKKQTTHVRGSQPGIITEDDY